VSSMYSLNPPRVYTSYSTMPMVVFAFLLCSLFMTHYFSH
jgi:hypothetical protein